MTTKFSRGRALLLGFVAMAIAGALGAAAMLAPDDQVDARHCVVGKPPKTVLVLAFDVSDPLVSVAPREIALGIERALNGLGKGDHVVALDIPGTAVAELPTVVDVCDPGDDDNEQRLAFQTAIMRPIMRHLDAIRALPSAPQSPIIETILGIAHDPSLHDPGAHLSIFLVTDALQNTTLQSAYRKGSRFPTPDPTALAGVDISLFIVKNDRDIRRQPQAVHRLKLWLEQSGAHVDFNAPGWLTLARSQVPGKRA